MILNREVSKDFKKEILNILKSQCSNNCDLIWSKWNRGFYIYSVLICRPNNYFILMGQDNNVIDIKELFPFINIINYNKHIVSNGLTKDFLEIFEKWIVAISKTLERSDQIAKPLEVGEKLRKQYTKLSKNIPNSYGD